MRDRGASKTDSKPSSSDDLWHAFQALPQEQRSHFIAVLIAGTVKRMP